MIDNKLNADIAIAIWIGKHPETNLEAAREVVAQCGSVTDADRCEASNKIYHCLHDAAVAKGLKDPDE